MTLAESPQLRKVDDDWFVLLHVPAKVSGILLFCKAVAMRQKYVIFDVFHVDSLYVEHYRKVIVKPGLITTFVAGASAAFLNLI